MMLIEQCKYSPILVKKFLLVIYLVSSNRYKRIDSAEIMKVYLGMPSDARHLLKYRIIMGIEHFQRTKSCIDIENGIAIPLQP